MPRDTISFFFNDPPTTEIYTLSLHDALPISGRSPASGTRQWDTPRGYPCPSRADAYAAGNRRSEEHTSELQSRRDLVCRLLLEKKKKYIILIASSNYENII